MKNRAVIKRALRMVGVTGQGRDPSPTQAAGALEALQDICQALIPSLCGGPWLDQDVTSNVQAEEDDRLRVNSLEPVTIDIPSSVTFRERVIDQCGCITVRQVCSAARAPNDLAKVCITDVYGTIDPRIYLYRADAALWVLASLLTLDGDCPLGVQYKEGLAAELAAILSVEYDQPISRPVALLQGQFRLALAGRFDRPRTTTPAEYF